MKYNSKIDGLRFIAILFVLIEHFAKIIGGRIGAGYYGVDLFFVISGFLITYILYSSNEDTFWNSYKKFIGRRTLRIFPIFYLTVIILLIFQMSYVQQYLVFIVSYTFNYAKIYYHMPFSPIIHFWSLCVEEQFYLFWPFIVLSLRKKPKFLLAIILFIIVLGFSQMTFSIMKSMKEYNYVNLLTRMGSLGMGAFGALLYKTNKLPDNLLRNKFVEYLFLILLVVCLVIHSRFIFFPLACCSLYFIMKVVHSDFSINILNTILTNKLMVYIGSISYGVYVYHLPLGYYLSKYIFDPVWSSINFQSLGWLKIIENNSWVIKFPIYSIITILVASLSSIYIEKPILKLKDKYFGYSEKNV